MKWKICIAVILALAFAVPSLAGHGFESLLFEDFESCSPPAPPPGWTILVSGDAGEWESRAYGGVTWGRQCMRYKGDPVTAANDWFFSSGVDLAAGQGYEIAIQTRVSSGLQHYDLGVYAGTVPDVPGMTELVIYESVVWTDYIEIWGVFTPPTSDTYYFGFHATGLASPYRLFVDDVHLKKNELDLNLEMAMTKTLYQDPPIYSPGDDTVTAFVYIKNQGADAEILNTRFAVGKHPADTELEFIVMDPDGIQRPIINMFAKSKPAAAGDFQTLQPDSTAGKVVNLWNWYEFDKIGAYTIWAIYRSYSDPGGLGAWNGQLESDPIIITVQ